MPPPIPLGLLESRKTFSGFTPRDTPREGPSGADVSPKRQLSNENGQTKRHRGRFEIESTFEEPSVEEFLAQPNADEPHAHREVQKQRGRDNKHMSSLRRLVKGDKYPTERRSRIFSPGIKKPIDFFSWLHLGDPRPATRREGLLIEPIVIKAGKVLSDQRRSSEFPPSNANNGGGNRTPSFGSFTRRAITTLLPGSKKRLPDVLFILNLVRLAIIDRGELRACLLLHVGFGLVLPERVNVGPNTRIPDFIGSHQPSLFKKIVYYPVLARIFLLALLAHMDAVCFMLIKAGFPKCCLLSIFPADRHGFLPSFLLAALSLERLEVAKCLVDNARPSSSDLIAVNRKWRGWTSLSLTIALLGRNHTKSCFQITAALLEWGSDPRILNPSGLSALDLASGQENCDILIIILNWLTKNHYSNHVRQSKWCLLLQRNVDITVRLLNAGAKVDQRDQHGNTPLILAAEHGNTDLMAVLLHYDAKIDVTNKDGWTALHAAAGGAHRSSVEFLICKGADCSILNRNNETALQLCLKSGIPTDDLLDYFDHDQRVLRLSTHDADMQNLLTKLDSVHLNHVPSASRRLRSKGKGRFIIEKLISIPRQWFSTLTTATSYCAALDQPQENNSPCEICPIPNISASTKSMSTTTSLSISAGAEVNADAGGGKCK